MVGSVSTLPGDQNHVSDEKKLSCCGYIYICIYGDFSTQFIWELFQQPLEGSLLNNQYNGKYQVIQAVTSVSPIWRSLNIQFERDT